MFTCSWTSIHIYISNQLLPYIETFNIIDNVKTYKIQGVAQFMIIGVEMYNELMIYIQSKEFRYHR